MLRVPTTHAAIAVDAGVEEVEADVRAAEEVAAHELLADRREVVVEHHDVIAVPADAAADVQQDLRHEHQHRADLVGDRLGRVIVAGVERVEQLARERVAEIELVRADGVALDAEAEQLALERVEVVRRDRSAPANISSSDATSRSRGPRRSTGVSFMPSGIQWFVTHGVPSAAPIAAPMRRHAIAWRIQKARIAGVRRAPA